jgi:hypothetical protein
MDPPKSSWELGAGSRELGAGSLQPTGHRKSLAVARLFAFSDLRDNQGKFFFYPLLSGYQVQLKNWPNIFEVIKMEAVWNQRQHFGTVRGKLDKFSTFRVWTFGGAVEFEIPPVSRDPRRR